MIYKMFRITLIICLLITSFLLSGTAGADDDELPDPGITPDSPFYFLDNWGKEIGLFFTFGPEAKARKALRYAEERLAEAQVMAAKNRARTERGMSFIIAIESVTGIGIPKRNS